MAACRAGGDQPGVNSSSPPSGLGGSAASWDGQAGTPDRSGAQHAARVALTRHWRASECDPATRYDCIDVQAPADSALPAPTRSFSRSRTRHVQRQAQADGRPGAGADGFPRWTPAPRRRPSRRCSGSAPGGQVTWNSDPVDAAGLACAAWASSGSTAAIRARASWKRRRAVLELARRSARPRSAQLSSCADAGSYHLRPGVYLPVRRGRAIAGGAAGAAADGRRGQR